MPTLLHTTHGPLEYEVHGQGVPVLALHGAMGGWDQSLLLARAALPDQGFQTLAVSRPGSLATPLSAGLAPEAQADLYPALLDHLHLDRAFALAISGGGQSAVQFALRHPARCRGLILISACTAPLTAALPARFHLLKLAARWPWLLGKMAAGQSLDDRLRRAVLNPIHRQRLRDNAAALALFEELQAATMGRMAERLPGTMNDVANSRQPFSYPFDQLKCPVLLAHGTADTVVPVALSERLAAQAPQSQLLFLEGGEHVALFTHRDEIRQAVAEFLSPAAIAAVRQRKLPGSPSGT